VVQVAAKVRASAPVDAVPGGPASDGERADAAAVRAAAAGGAFDDRAARMVEALRVERHGYVLRGMPARVAQVDEQLSALGAMVEG
jgi:hypothetical protein